MAAPATRTTDSAACKINNPLCGFEEASRVLRLTPRNASTGFVVVANQAGAVPKITPVSSDKVKANAITGSDGLVSIPSR